MKKGHRRTQSSYISQSQAQDTLKKQKQTSNNIIQLLKQSENKIKNKIINYERLQISNQQQNNFLSFGNYTIDQLNKQQHNIRKQQKNYKQDLISIKENSKSSEISSQKMSHQGIIQQISQKKVKPKRISDFDESKQQNSYNKKKMFSEIRHKKIKSFKMK